MTPEEIKTAVQKWGRKVGQKQARAQLVAKGIGLSTTGKLLSGRYKSAPTGHVLEALESVLGLRDGQAAS